MIDFASLSDEKLLKEITRGVNFGPKPSIIGRSGKGCLVYVAGHTGWGGIGFRSYYQASVYFWDQSKPNAIAEQVFDGGKGRITAKVREQLRKDYL